MHSVRKHRKLLKDGSGSEVWPEDVEALFFRGLQDYWKSPWASYSRGRSRWRNQFLVSYLDKAGISRSKKQVASHMQVLRNMWKGAPEYRWVAGTDESSIEPEEHPTAVKVEDDISHPITSDRDFETRSSGSQSTPALSPSRSTPATEFSPPPYWDASNCSSPYNPPPIHHGSTEHPSELYSPTQSNPLYTFTPMERSKHYVDISANFSDFPLPMSWSTPPPVDKHSPPSLLHPKQQPLISPSVPSQVATPTYQNAGPSISSLSIQAESMPCFTVQVHSISSQPTVRIKLYLPAVDDALASPTLQGFVARIALSLPWSSSGECMTSLYTSEGCVSRTTDNLDPEWLNHHIFLPGTPITVILPCLPQCRWLPDSILSITQQVILDSQLVANIGYELDRHNGGFTPSAVLLGSSNCRAGNFQIPPPTYRNVTVNTRSTSSSLSGALTPIVR